MIGVLGYGVVAGIGVRVGRLVGFEVCISVGLIVGKSVGSSRVDHRVGSGI